MSKVQKQKNLEEKPLNNIENYSELNQAGRNKVFLEQYKIYLSSYEETLKRNKATYRYFIFINSTILGFFVTAITATISMGKYQTLLLIGVMSACIMLFFINLGWIINEWRSVAEFKIKYCLLVDFEKFLPLNFFSTEYFLLQKVSHYLEFPELVLTRFTPSLFLGLSITIGTGAFFLWKNFCHC